LQTKKKIFIVIFIHCITTKLVQVATVMH